MADSYAPLTAVLIRALGDKVCDKRKTAAGEVSRIVKDFVLKQEPQQIAKIISVLTKVIVEQNANSRIGGLMGLAAVSVGLGPKLIELYICDLVRPTLPCFKDQSPHVRYYATESLYNISLVARGVILVLLDEIFMTIVDLAMDTDTDVQNGSDLLDRAIKGIIVESSAFDLVSFISVLREKLYVTDVAAQTRVISWVNLLEDVPDVNLIPFLPQLLDGLFLILESPKMELKKMTEVVIGQFSAAIRKNPEKVKYTDAINILIAHAQSNDSLVQMLGLTWILDFIKLSKREMLPYSSGILNAAIPCLAYDDPSLSKTRTLAEETCHSLIDLITPRDDFKREEEKEAVPGPDGDLPPKELNLTTVMEMVVRQLENNTPVACKTMILKLVYHLNNKIPIRMQKFVEELFRSLLRNISDPAEEVVLLALQVLAQISSSNFPRLHTHDKKHAEATAGLDEPGATSLLVNAGLVESPLCEHEECLRGGKYFTTLVRTLLKLFAVERNVLKDRGHFIIRHLCVMLSSEELYSKFAELLLNEDDLSFATEMVQNLSTILLTSKELSFLRLKLRHLNTKDSCDLFTKLYKTWCHSPVAMLTLCLLAQKYQHAVTIVQVFGQIDVTTDFLLEMDRLIQMLESPIFAFLRLQLLTPTRNPALVETLYGMLMLLPQTEAFNLLRTRLNCVPPAHLIKVSSEEEVKENGLQWIDFVSLLEHFHKTQRRHQIFQQNQIIERLQSTLVISSS